MLRFLPCWGRELSLQGPRGAFLRLHLSLSANWEEKAEARFPLASASSGAPRPTAAQDLLSPALQGNLRHLPGAPAAFPGDLTSSWLHFSWIFGAVHQASLCKTSWPGSAPAAASSISDLGVGDDVAGVLARWGAGNNFSCVTRQACQRLTLFFTKRRTFIS